MEPNAVRRQQEAPIDGYLATFKFYDSKNRRLSIFSRIVNGELEITVLTLSNTPEVKKKEQQIQSIRKDGNGRRKSVKLDVVYTEEYVYDTFSKKEGRQKYENSCISGGDECPGRKVTIPIIDNRPRYTFLKWCSDHFYRQWKEKVTVTKVKYVRGTKYSELLKEAEEKKAVIIPLVAEHENTSETVA